MKDSRKPQGRTSVRSRQTRTALLSALALFATCCIAVPWGSAQAQSTTAMIHGQAPAGDTIVAKSDSGFRHQTTVRPDGKYMLRNLPLGVYSVTLKQGDKTIDMYHHVPLTVSRGALLNFACPHDKCAATDDDTSS